MMRRRCLALSLLFWCSLFWCSFAVAQEADEICLPLETHRAILADLRELHGDGSSDSGLRAHVKLLDNKLMMQAEQMADLRLAERLAASAKDAASQALLAAERGRREAEEARDAWYRAPMLWFGVGIVGTVVTAAVVGALLP